MMSSFVGSGPAQARAVTRFVTRGPNPTLKDGA